MSVTILTNKIVIYMYNKSISNTIILGMYVFFDDIWVDLQVTSNNKYFSVWKYLTMPKYF